MKKAFCSGKNYVGTSNELLWCVKDATDLTSFLQGWGFITETVLERESTPESFLNGLRRLVNQARWGEIDGFVFTHSGHGTRKYNSAEEDYYDEALYFETGLVLDDEIGEIIDLIPDGFPNLIFFDVCHSGGMMRLMRLINGNKIRYVQPSFVIPGAKLRNRICREISKNEVFISACKSDEYSYDAGALRNGAATHYLIQSFAKNNTFKEWIEKINLYLPSDTYPQTPELMCKEENKINRFPKWFNPVTTNIPNIPNIPPTPSEPSELESVKLSFWKRFWNWIKKLFCYV